LIRGIAIWAFARLLAKALYLVIASSVDHETATAFTTGSPIILAGWTLVLSAALVRVDLYRRHEVALLNNLGVMTSHAILLGTLPAVVMEVAMAIVT
jgi:hypothetical protein